MKKQDLETIRENTNRTVLMMINEISKFFEDEMIKNKDFAILKDKTARHILSYLSSNDGATQQELVVVSQMKGSTVSVAVRKLETEGYLQRETNEYDMRSVKVYLTKKGRELSEKIKNHLNSRDEKIMHGISPKDIRTAKYVLEKMIDNMID
jgi:DNA-binding MarR family transcriptional regulator